jgi:hypothetical protein
MYPNCTHGIDTRVTPSNVTCVHFGAMDDEKSVAAITC